MLCPLAGKHGRMVHQNPGRTRAFGDDGRTEARAQVPLETGPRDGVGRHGGFVVDPPFLLMGGDRNRRTGAAAVAKCAGLT